MRLPNAWIVAAIAACLGAAAGGGIAAFEAAARPWRAGDLSIGKAVPAGPSPVAETPETKFAFGTVGVGAHGSHDFVIRNAGTAALELTKGATSCTCTVADFEADDGGTTAVKRVAPGESTTLTVRWRGKGDGGPFRQQASVLTNDPRRPQIAFAVEGTVVPTFKAIPPSLALPKMTATSSQRATVKIFTYGREPPVVDNVGVSDEKTSRFFSVASAALEPAEVAAEIGATGGLRIDIDVHPGLPLGPVRQGIKAVFRMPEEIAAEIPLEGSVTGDLALAGAEWDSSREALMLGTVSSRTGSSSSLYITVKGPHREAVRPVVRQVVPDFLQVVVGEGKPVGSGGVVRIPLSITIPPGSPPANHVCSQQAPAGRIVLETGHPDSPTLTVRVCVSVVP